MPVAATAEMLLWGLGAFCIFPVLASGLAVTATGVPSDVPDFAVTGTGEVDEISCVLVGALEISAGARLSKFEVMNNSNRIPIQAATPAKICIVRRWLVALSHGRKRQAIRSRN